MFFNSEFVCPKCGARKMFHVHEIDSINGRKADVMVFTAEGSPAKDWSVTGDCVNVSMYCEKCWKTFHKSFDFKGNPIGEDKWEN